MSTEGVTPTFCKLEYLTPDGWVVGHSGINLIHPRRYVERLAKNGKIGRIIVPDTGEIIQMVETSICPVCDQEHAAPFDGSCLL